MASNDYKKIKQIESLADDISQNLEEIKEILSHVKDSVFVSSANDWIGCLEDALLCCDESIEEFNAGEAEEFIAKSDDDDDDNPNYSSMDFHSSDDDEF